MMYITYYLNNVNYLKCEVDDRTSKISQEGKRYLLTTTGNIMPN